MGNNLTPIIRFNGFTDAWEQRKLGEVISDFIVPMRDKPKEFNGSIPWTRIEDIEGKYLNGSLSNQFVSEDTIKKMNLKIIPKNSLIVSASATFGIVAIVTTNLITNQTFIGLVPNKDNDLNFLYTLFISNSVRKKMKIEAAGSTIFYIPRQTFENMIVIIPKKDEQIKIGNFFKQLDDTIALHQRELDLLKEQKKGFLQKMFPKKDETIPEIRFEGFTDAWEQRKLVENVKDILDYRGKSPRKFNMQWGNSGYLVLSALNVKDGYIDKKIEAKYGNQELFEKWMGNRRLEKGDVIFTTEAPLGNVAQIPDDKGYILNQRAVAFKIDDNKSNNNFFAQLLGSPYIKSKLKSNSSGGTAKGIGMKEFSKLSACVPTDKEEAKAIGTFLIKLDDTIALHQRKVELLKELKKGYLQNMFV